MVANFYDSCCTPDWLCRWVQCEDCVASLFWAPPIEAYRRTPPLRVRVLVVERHIFFAPHPNLRLVLSVLGDGPVRALLWTCSKGVLGPSKRVVVVVVVVVVAIVLGPSSVVYEECT